MDIQRPKIRQSKTLYIMTSVWIIPLTALIVALWLVYQYFSELGPEIKIIFPRNEGLIAGQSQIKYKDVAIGIVDKIKLREEGDGVIVIARMEKNLEKYLNENTSFKIIKPEVGFGGVSGLETLISGTYINMQTDKIEENRDIKKFYNELEGKIINRDGKYFVLNAPSSYNITNNTPIYFKNIKVGNVEYINISLDENSVDMIIYIKPFYVPFIHEDSKFWINSTLSADFSLNHLDVSVAPLSNLVRSGISFSSSKKDENSTIKHDFVFHLYPNENEAKKHLLNLKGKKNKPFKLYLNSIDVKIDKKTPIRYKGFNIGFIDKIERNFNAKTHNIKANLTLKIDTNFFKDNTIKLSGEENLLNLIKEGLVAQITPINIMGSLAIDLIFDKNSSNKTIIREDGIIVLNKKEYKENGILAKADEFMTKLNSLPLKELIEDIDKLVLDIDKPLKSSLISLNKSLKNLNKMTKRQSFQKMPNEINKTLREITKTLKETKVMLKGYNSKSLFHYRLTQTLKTVTKAAQEMKLFLKMLNRKPTSLILGDK